jgi:hypothetical protein
MIGGITPLDSKPGIRSVWVFENPLPPEVAVRVKSARDNLKRDLPIYPPNWVSGSSALFVGKKPDTRWIDLVFAVSRLRKVQCTVPAP